MKNKFKLMEESGNAFSADDIVEVYEKECRNKTTVFNFLRQQISLLREAGRYSTANHYAQTLSSLMRFRGGQDLSFDTFTPLFALAYETWLRHQHLCRNSSSFYMRNLRSLYNKAVAAGLSIDCHPFLHVYTGIDKTAKRALTKADLTRIKEASLSHRSTLDFAHDMFAYQP